MEVWKEIDFTNGNYSVSDCGRVRNNNTGRILKPSHDGNRGYFRVCLFKYDKEKRFKVHRLVAYAFIDNPLNLPQVNHKDGDKSNNRVSNLEWVSAKENSAHAKATGLRKRHEDYCKLQRKPVIGTFISTGEEISFNSITDAIKYVGSHHVQEVLKGKRSHCKGYSFRYS